VRHSVLHLSCDLREGGLGASDFGEDVVRAGGPDEGLGVLVVMLDVLRNGLSSSLTVAKLSRLIRFSEMSRKKRSTMFNQEALVGVKCMTTRGCLSSHF